MPQRVNTPAYVGSTELPGGHEVMQITAMAPDLSGLDPDTRSRIEQAVLDIFSQREFHRVGLIEIARAANVSLQTIYKYYGGKEQLLFSSLDAWLGMLAARMIDHLQGIEDYKEKLRKVMWVTLDFFEKNPKVAQLIMSSVYVNTWRKQETYRNPQLFSAFLKVLSEGRARGILNDQVDEKSEEHTSELQSRVDISYAVFCLK